MVGDEKILPRHVGFRADPYWGVFKNHPSKIYSEIGNRTNRKSLTRPSLPIQTPIMNRLRQILDLPANSAAVLATFNILS